MRTVRCPAPLCAAEAMVEVRGVCRACEKENVVRVVNGHPVTLMRLACEHCGRKQESNPKDRKKRKKGKPAGIEWRGQIV